MFLVGKCKSNIENLNKKKVKRKLFYVLSFVIIVSPNKKLRRKEDKLRGTGVEIGSAVQRIMGRWKTSLAQFRFLSYTMKQ